MKLKLSLLLGLGLSLWGQTPYTAIMDTLTPAADGEAVTGSINVSWTEFTYAAATIAQSPTGGATYSVVAGAVDIPLAPTDHSAAPVTYTVKATIGGRAVTTYWSVPTLPSGQCASSSYCTVKEVTVAFPAGPSTVVNPSQISTGSSTPGQVLCNVSGIIGFCSTASGAWGSITGMLDAQADLLAALNAKLGVDANAVSATALAALPSACASGYAPQGVDTGGNALDCQAVGTGGSLPSFNVTTTTTVITLAAGTVHTAANGDSQVGPYTITNSGADTASGAFQVAGATATNAGQCWYSGITLSKWTITFPGSTCINGSPLSATAACVVSISVVSGAVQAAPSQYPCVSVPVITQGSGITVTQGTNVACNAATTSSPGCIEPDGTTCTTSGGVLTCGGGGSSSYQTRADVVFGYSGGGLGILQPGAATNLALAWNSAGNVGIGTNSPNQKLVVAGNIYATGTITPNSDRNQKTDFASVDPATVLAKVAALPIQEWRFKAEQTAVRHIGPMAQDFRAAFGLGEVPTAIATVDADGVALAAIQGLNQKLEETRAENADLKARLEKLEQLRHR